MANEMSKKIANTVREEAVIGCVIGTAVGDALGLPWEGLPAKRQAKNIDKHQLIFGRGMCSDDTEHTCIVIKALIDANGDIEVFRRSLAWQLRWWFLTLPAGIGRATARSLLKLCIGFPASHSGVFSAGNGPAMRSAIIGVMYGHDPQTLYSFVHASTYITHTDPKAELGALAVAIAAHLSSCNINSTDKFMEQIQKYCDLFFDEKDTTEFLSLLSVVVHYVKEHKSATDLCKHLGLQTAVSGYIYHTLPVVIFMWLKYPNDYNNAILNIIRCGGDSDTTAAILGGIIGASVGKNGIRESWQRGIMEWPRTILWMENLAKRLISSKGKIPKVNFFCILLRNIFFLCVVLFHGFWRIFSRLRKTSC